MASIPQQQISDAYYHVNNWPKQWYGFGRGYNMYYDGKDTYKLVHYGTTIYECNERTKKAKVGGWSMSDVAAINSLAYHTGTPKAYMTGGSVYLVGTGPRYEKKNKGKGKRPAPFGL